MTITNNNAFITLVDFFKYIFLNFHLYKIDALFLIKVFISIQSNDVNIDVLKHTHHCILQRFSPNPIAHLNPLSPSLYSSPSTYEEKLDMCLCASGLFGVA